MLHKGRLVYLDLHKTGSTFLVRFLNDEVRGTLQHFVKHQPGALNRKVAGQVWVMSVRDPISYYVSLWSYGAKSQRGPWRAFEDSTRDRLYDSSNPDAFRDWLAHLAAGKGLAKNAAGQVDNAHGKSIARSAELGCGLYTLRLLTMATAAPLLKEPDRVLGDTPTEDLASWYSEHTRVDEIVRLENLIPDLTRVLSRPELQLRAGALERLAKSRPQNESKHEDPRSYYDEESLALVRERDHLIFELFYT